MTSVLFPSGDAPPEVEVPPDCFHDLRLGDIVAAVCEGYPDDRVARLFYQPLREVSAVQHRHQVFSDLERSHVRHMITEFTKAMATMRGQLRNADWVQHRWQRHGWFVHAVATYCHAIATLRAGLADAELSSRGLRDIAEYLDGYARSETFRTLTADARTVLTEFGAIRYTVQIHDRHVRVGKYAGQTDYGTQATAIFDRFASEMDRHYGVPFQADDKMGPVEQRILECVAKLHPEAFTRLEQFTRHHRQFIEPTVSRFDREIRFYILYSAFMERFAGARVNFCYPEITDTPGPISADDARDLALALKAEGEPTTLIGNGFHLSEDEQVLVVTGPNQGGKTTFARTIGQCAYLASLGCPVPAKRASFTLPDTIYTHFDRQENLSTPRGKLHDELLRIRDILSQATPASLIIMNESFSSTTVSDALQIGADIIRRIIKRDSTAVYVSFLGELASVDPACVSMVGDVATDDPTRRTFTFTRRPADGLAYAAALATKHGLTYYALRRRIAQ